MCEKGKQSLITMNKFGTHGLSKMTKFITSAAHM